jgi:hypothetical protein
MASDVARAMLRLGSSSGEQQQQHASLLVPLAALGYGSGSSGGLGLSGGVLGQQGLGSGGGLLGGGQGGGQMLAGAAASIAAGLLAV